LDEPVKLVGVLGCVLRVDGVQRLVPIWRGTLPGIGWVVVGGRLDTFSRVRRNRAVLVPGLDGPERGQRLAELLPAIVSCGRNGHRQCACECGRIKKTGGSLHSLSPYRP